MSMLWCERLCFQLRSECVQVVEVTDREAVGELLRLKEYVDVIIPRGGVDLCIRGRYLSVHMLDE